MFAVTCINSKVAWFWYCSQSGGKARKICCKLKINVVLHSPPSLESTFKGLILDSVLKCKLHFTCNGEFQQSLLWDQWPKAWSAMRWCKLWKVEIKANEILCISWAYSYVRKHFSYLSIRVVDVKSRANGFHRTGVAMYVLENTLVFNWKIKG